MRSQSATDPLAWLDDLTPDEQRALLAEAVAELSRDKIAGYRPYAKQRIFHELGATKRERLLRAGNQNGKTYCCGAEVSYHLTGEYPEWWVGRRWDRPVVVWASSETAESTRDNPQRALLGLPGETGTGAVPARALGDYGMAAGTADLYDYIKVRHVSGGWSLLRLKYYAQGRRKWQGPPVDFVWFDEEPPEDIYDEGLARTIATGGCAAMTFTPLLGMSNVVLRFLGKDATPDRADVNMTIEDAEHIPQEERARIIASFPAHEREARAKGIPILGSGRIFPVPEDDIKVAPFQIPEHWPRINGLDFGWDHPTAAVQCAWDRDADVLYVTRAHRLKEAVPLVHAATVKAWGEWVPTAWPHDGLQHDKGSGEQLAEQYRKAGLLMLKERATHPPKPGQPEGSGGNSVEAGLLDMLERMMTGRFKVFSNLDDWFEEFRLYHRKDGQIVKLMDDLISATRYALMMRRKAVIRPVEQQVPVSAWSPLDPDMGY
jgi:phage terminase large subunit-like protein